MTIGVKVTIEREPLNEDDDYVYFDVDVLLAMTYKGCEAHYGSLSYPGHPAEAPEYDLISIDVPEGFVLTEAEKDFAYEKAIENHPKEERDWDDYPSYGYDNTRDM